MKTPKNAVSMDLRVKKKKAFSISSKDLADAVAEYTANGGEITRLKIPGKRNPNQEVINGK